MSRDKVLPPQLTMHEVQSYLEMDRINGGHQKQFCDHVEIDDFPLYVKPEQLDIYSQECVEVTGGRKVVAKNAEALTINSELKVKDISYTKPPTMFDSGYDKNAKVTPYKINMVLYKGINYYVTEKGKSSIGAELNESEFFCKRDDLYRYRAIDLEQDYKGSKDLVIQDDDLAGSELQTYLNPDSEFYPMELDLANRLFMAIQIEKYGNQSQSREDRVVSWLAENRPDKKFSNAAVTRLSAIISSKKTEK